VLARRYCGGVPVLTELQEASIMEEKGGVAFHAIDRKAL
jgi:hypothetical protein